MAEVALIRGALYREDRPWKRLRWTLPAAMLGWALLLWTLGLLLGHRPPLPPPETLDATLIEMPAEPASPKTKIPRPAPRAAPPEPARPVEPEPIPIPETSTDTAPAHPEPPAPAPAPPPPQATAANTSTAPRALYRPLPVIPEEMREAAIDLQALARFDIRADGTATVELVQATPNPTLNRIILDTLKTWRFFPATERGRPVASVQEVRVKLEVR